MNVYVVTNPELGWDCVCGVFESREDAVIYCSERDKTTPDKWDEGESMWIIHNEQLKRSKQMIRETKLNEILK